MARGATMVGGLPAEAVPAERSTRANTKARMGVPPLLSIPPRHPSTFLRFGTAAMYPIRDRVVSDGVAIARAQASTDFCPSRARLLRATRQGHSESCARCARR